MGGMTDLPGSLVELARLFGVATEYVDWTGRQAGVADSTLIAVLDALGVPAATDDERTAALAAYDRDYWARSLPATIVGRAGAASAFWVHVTHGDPVGLWIRLEDGSVRTGLRQLENNRAPFDFDGKLIGEATFELPGDLPLGYHELHLQVGSLDTSTVVIVSPASLDLPPRLGSSRALTAILGHRRFDGSDRPRRMVRRQARCGIHPGQPAARGDTDSPDGAVALSADISPVRQPAVPAA
jgi:4-alpha-glucanotransferase